jgi:hypothetical protein
MKLTGSITSNHDYVSKDLPERVEVNEYQNNPTSSKQDHEILLSSVHDDDTNHYMVTMEEHQNHPSHLNITEGPDKSLQDPNSYY